MFYKMKEEMRTNETSICGLWRKGYKVTGVVKKGYFVVKKPRKLRIED